MSVPPPKESGSKATPTRSLLAAALNVVPPTRSRKVNLNQVREISPLFQGSYQLTLKNGAEVEVSRRQAAELFKRMGK